MGSSGWQLHVTLHGWQWPNLSAGPASLALPQPTVRPLAQPAVPSCLADDPLVMVNVGYPANSCNARLQHLTREADKNALVGARDWHGSVGNTALGGFLHSMRSRRRREKHKTLECKCGPDRMN